VFFVSQYFFRSTDSRSYSTGGKYSVSLSKRLVRGVFYVGSVLLHPWYCFRKDRAFRRRTAVSCTRFRGVCSLLVSRKWAVVFVNVSSQNTNAQIVVSCSRLKSVVSFRLWPNVTFVTANVKQGRTGSVECGKQGVYNCN